ncbi:MAG: MFS transporter [Acidobacteriota bacterium]
MPTHVPQTRSVHPVALTILYLPFGISGGYFTVTLAYLLAHAGVSVNQVAALVALTILPGTWKVLWAPIIDTTLTAKRWYILSAWATGLAILATAFVPARENSLWVLSALTLLVSTLSTVLGMATEILMTHSTAQDQRGRAGGWSQAGNLGGSGLGGGAGLWMAQHVAPWSAGVLLGLVCLLCCMALRWFQSPIRSSEIVAYRDSLAAIGKDVLALVRSRVGFLTVVLLFLPLGTGAASGLWPAIADDWHATADTVALVNGALGGILSMVGCLIGGYLCDRMDRKTGYAVFGIVLAACAVGMGLAPRTPFTFIVFTSAYAFFLGFAYAAFTAVVLEIIGTRSAATQYNVLACLSNIPIAYMTTVDGLAQTKWGSSGMLYTEAALGVAAAVFFMAIVRLTNRSRSPVVA